MKDTKKLRNDIQALCRVYRKLGATGLMFIQYGDKDRELYPRVAYQNKISISLEQDIDKIYKEVEKLIFTIAPVNIPEAQVVMRAANWYFIEYTKGTSGLSNPYKTVAQSDFKGYHKHVIYFDMDIKDQLSSDNYSRMTPEDKRTYVGRYKDRLNDLVKETDPLYILFTGNGVHIGYVAEDLVFASNQWRASSEAYTDGYKLLMSKLRKMTGWSFDVKCSSINRVDRLPSTYNIKSPDVANDTFSEFMFINENAKGTFTKPLVMKVETPDILRKMASETGTQGLPMYTILPSLRDSNPFVYKYIHSNLSFRSLFEHFEISETLRYPYDEDYGEGFQTCFSPFRKHILGTKAESEEHKPSFRFDESTKKFYDFGKIPHTDSNSGDVVGLAYGLYKLREDGQWPDKVLMTEAVDIALKIMGKKTVADLREEMTGFLRDDKGNVIADFDSVARIAVNILFNKYELVFNKVQEQLLFREVGTRDEFSPFPWECTEFGQKDKITSARLLLNLCGVGNPTSALLNTAKHIVDSITDPRTIKVNSTGLHAYFDIEAIKDMTMPVIDLDNPVIKFTDGAYYHLRTGNLTPEYNGYAYAAGVSHKEVVNAGKGVYFDMLLQGLVGDEDSPERMVFKYLLAQMWFKAHGDSRAVVIKGVGRNGKSTLVDVLSAVLPQGVVYNCEMGVLTSDRSSEVASRINFLGKHLIIVDDVTEQDLSLKLKPLITGGGGVTAKLLFKNPVTFHNTASLLFMTNTFPRINRDISAFLRRFLVIESKVKIRDVIVDLKDKILKEERAAVWAYIINAIEYFREKHNFAFPEKEKWAQGILTPMKKALINQMSTGEIALGLKPSAGKVVSLRHLYEYFLEYSEVIGARKSSLKSFSERIASIVEGDSEIYGDNWEKDFEEIGMDETFVLVYRNGQAEYLVNFEFVSPIKIPVKPLVNQSLDAVLSLKDHAETVRCQSVRNPMAESSDVLSRLKDWRVNHMNPDGTPKMKALKASTGGSLPFTPTRTYTGEIPEGTKGGPAATPAPSGIDLS